MPGSRRMPMVSPLVAGGCHRRPVSATMIKHRQTRVTPSSLSEATVIVIARNSQRHAIDPAIAPDRCSSASGQNKIPAVALYAWCRRRRSSNNGRRDHAEGRLVQESHRHECRRSSYRMASEGPTGDSRRPENPDNESRVTSDSDKANAASPCRHRCFGRLRRTAGRSRDRSVIRPVSGEYHGSSQRDDQTVRQRHDLQH